MVSLIQVVKASKSSAVALLVLYSLRRTLLLPSALRSIALLVLALNWHNLPFAWHIRLFLPTFKLRLLALLARQGLYNPSHSQAKALGFPKVDWPLHGVGVSPFVLKRTSQSNVSIGDADFNMHMSNSVYGQRGDVSRMDWATVVFGPALVIEGVQLALGGLNFVWFKEIPLFESYEVETCLATWDERWFFAFHRFTIKRTKKTAINAPLIKTATSNGQERVLCALALSKVAVRMPKHKGFIHPGRLLALTGFGPDGSNWTRSKALRKARKGKAFLAGTEGGESDGLEAYEDQRLKTLEVISRLGGGEKKSIWLEVEALSQA